MMGEVIPFFRYTIKIKFKSKKESEWDAHSFSIDPTTTPTLVHIMTAKEVLIFPLTEELEYIKVQENEYGK